MLKGKVVHQVNIHKKLLRNSMIILIALFTLDSCAQTSKQVALEKIFNDITINKKFNGVVLISQNDKTILYNSYGYKDLNKRVKHTNESIFLIGSNTKQFTSEVILKLMYENKIKLTDRLNSYLPDYPNGENISIYNLLTHTSGIYNYTEKPCIDSIDPTRPISLSALISLFSSQQQRFEPNSKYEYSNSNYVLLGYIIESVTKQEYEKVVRDEIFTPFRMDNSGFDFVNLDDTNKSISYYNVNGKMYQYELFDSTFSYAAGGIYSTAKDMLSWYMALHLNKILPPKIQKRAYEPYMNNYALGWSVNKYRNQEIIFHFGSNAGFKCIELFKEDDDTYIIILANYIDPNVDTQKLLSQVLEVLYN